MYRLRRCNNVDKEPKYSYMTKFEMTLALARRSRFIIKNSPPVLVAVKKETDVQRLAVLELEQNVLPIAIRRIIPDTEEYEDWELDDDQDVYKDLTSVY